MVATPVLYEVSPTGAKTRKQAFEGCNGRVVEMGTVIDDEVERLIGKLHSDDLIQSLYVGLIGAVVQAHVCFQVAVCNQRVQELGSCCRQLDGDKARRACSEGKKADAPAVGDADLNDSRVLEGREEALVLLDRSHGLHDHELAGVRTPPKRRNMELDTVDHERLGREQIRTAGWVAHRETLAPCRRPAARAPSLRRVGGVSEVALSRRGDCGATGQEAREAKFGFDLTKLWGDGAAERALETLAQLIGGVSNEGVWSLCHAVAVPARLPTQSSLSSSRRMNELRMVGYRAGCGP